MNQAQLEAAYAGKRVFMTGHTGFKGGWLALWLQQLGAKVIGYALPPELPRGIFLAADVASSCEHHLGDVRDQQSVRQAIAEARPDVIFHLAAQSLVRRSYDSPVETFDINARGTAHVLEALKGLKAPVACVVVTSDKCYENQEWDFGYREEDPLGGHDVYSMSKAATELVVSSWRRSFFPPEKLASHGVKLATARAGNVIGGGDWAVDRIVPDSIAALSEHRPVGVRSPKSVRPWQHVLEPLAGYLRLGAELLGPNPERFCEGWNFGPDASSSIPVAPLVERLIAAWGKGRWEDISRPDAVHEASLLTLAIDKARVRLGWTPRWGLEPAVRHTVEWYRAQLEGATPPQLRELTQAQISTYLREPPSSPRP